MPRPPTNRAVAEEIARAYEKLDRQDLINILSYLTKVYVVDGTMPFNLVGDKGAPAGEADQALDFPKLIDQLKRRLPHIRELGYFQVEEGRVSMRVENQKITFGDRVTSEFVPTTSAPTPSPAAQARSAQSAIAAAGKAGVNVKGPKEEKQPELSGGQQEALNDIVTRFKNLELD